MRMLLEEEREKESVYVRVELICGRAKVLPR